MPEPIYTGAALLTALTAYADTLEAEASQSFLDAVVEFTNEGDLPEIMAELQQGRITIEDLPERIQLLEMNTSEIQTVVGKAVRGGGTITAKAAQLETAWDVTQPSVIEAALDYGAESITEINKTTQKTIAQLISNAIDTGMGRDELVDKIKQNVGLLPQHVTAADRYEQMLIDQGTSKREVKRLVKEYAERMLDYRANMIARTEVAQAMNIGQMQFWDQMQGRGLLPSNAQRIWMTADDERVCVICGPMDQVVAPLNGMWMTDNGAVSHPTQVHPQCRCAMGLVFEPLAKGIPQILNKFNPYHDKLGRFTTAGGAFSISGNIPASMVGTGSHLAALASANGGFTFNTKRGEFRQSGFAVSPYSELEADFSLDEWKTSGSKLVKGFIKKNAKTLREPNAHIGAWKGEDSQGRMRIFLDVSVVRNSSSSAANLARRHDQLAYFDLGTFTTMRRKVDNKYYSYSDDTGKFLDSDEIGKGLDRRGNVYFITPQATQNSDYLKIFINSVLKSPAVPMKDKVEKFNPYHDAIGRFTTAEGNVTGDASTQIIESAVQNLDPKVAEHIRNGGGIFHGTYHELKDGQILTGAEANELTNYNNPDLEWAPNPDNITGKVFATTNLANAQFWAATAITSGAREAFTSAEQAQKAMKIYELEIIDDTPLEPDYNSMGISNFTGERFRVKTIVLEGDDSRWVLDLQEPTHDWNDYYFGNDIVIDPDRWFAHNYRRKYRELSKFNPYHDKLGRFTTAEGNVTGTTPLGANREALVAMYDQARGYANITSDIRFGTGSYESAKEIIREAEVGELGASLQAFDQEERGLVKEKGAMHVYASMTPEERTILDDQSREGVEFIHMIQRQWAGTAGDSDPNSLAIQLVAAEMQGIEDVATRVFGIRVGQQHMDTKVINKEITRVKELIASTSDLDLSDSGDPQIRDRQLGIGRFRSTPRTPETTIYTHSGKDALDMVALAVIKAEGNKEPIKAVLNAQKRVTQKFLEEATGGAETITIFRGMNIPADPNKTAWEYKEMFESEATTLRSDSGPLSSWSFSIDTALKFTEGDMSLSEEMWSQKIGSFSTVLQANVPVSSIVASSAFGFGCLVEQEVIVDGSKFDFKALGANVETDVFVDDRGVYKGIETIDLDRYLVNQDWIKVLADDTYEALNLDPKKLSKFNPYHDKIGRFTTAQANMTGAGPVGTSEGASYTRTSLGVTGQPNPATGKVMSNVEFGDTMETLFRQRVARLSGFRKMFGGGLKQIIRRKGGARTGALDFRTHTHGIEVKSINSNSKDRRVKIDRKAALVKSSKAKELGLKGSIAVQVVDFDRGRVDVYGWDKGFKNTSKKASPKSRNIQFQPESRFTPLGAYRFNTKQWKQAQKATERRDNKGNVIGTWGDYEVAKLSPSQELEWKTELIKRRNLWSLPRPDFVERILKAKSPATTDDGRGINDGDTVIQLVEQGGYLVPYIYEAEGQISKFNPYHDKVGRFTFSPSGSGVPADEYYPADTERYGKLVVDTYLTDGESSYFDDNPKEMRAMLFEYNDCYLRLTAANKDIDSQVFAEILDAYGYMTVAFPGSEVGLLAFDKSGMREARWGGSTWGWANVKLNDYVEYDRGKAGIGPKLKDFASYTEFMAARKKFIEENKSLMERPLIHINKDILAKGRKVTVAKIRDDDGYTTGEERLVDSVERFRNSMVRTHTDKESYPTKTKENPDPEKVTYHVPINTTPAQALVVHEVGHVLRYKMAERAPAVLAQLENRVLKKLDPERAKERIDFEERTAGGSLKGFKWKVGRKGSDGKGKTSADTTVVADTNYTTGLDIRQNLANSPFGGTFTADKNVPVFITDKRSEKGKQASQTAALKVSGYAATNGDELFAELVTEAICSNNPRPAAKAMLDGLEELWPILYEAGAFD